MSARTRSIRAGMIRVIRNLPKFKRAVAWQAFRTFCAQPEAHALLNPPGSQAVHRERREAARRSRPLGAGQ